MLVFIVCIFVCSWFELFVIFIIFVFILFKDDVRFWRLVLVLFIGFFNLLIVLVRFWSFCCLIFFNDRILIFRLIVLLVMLLILVVWDDGLGVVCFFLWWDIIFDFNRVILLNKLVSFCFCVCSFFLCYWLEWIDFFYWLLFLWKCWLVFI